MITRLYVGNLSYSVTETQLRELFTRAGTVKLVTIPHDRDSNRPRGFAFVEMGTASEALNAIRLLDGEEVDGRSIRVNEARPRDRY